MKPEDIETAQEFFAGHIDKVTFKRCLDDPLFLTPPKPVNKEHIFVADHGVFAMLQYDAFRMYVYERDKPEPVNEEMARLQRFEVLTASSLNSDLGYFLGAVKDAQS